MGDLMETRNKGRIGVVFKFEGIETEEFKPPLTGFYQMVLSFPFIMPPRQDLFTDITHLSICEQLSTLIVISTANIHRLDAIIMQIATINTVIDLQIGTIAKLIPPPPLN
ncbi:unnamed protein product [Lactuca saligna]|uniref:Uncharacterized protein n=1 Tax=Lactuca saligna TaxID=75948 RepID=A0AA35VM69_LACSI|nr:unnamed protein product [Lactuca saligna]